MAFFPSVSGSSMDLSLTVAAAVRSAAPALNEADWTWNSAGADTDASHGAFAQV
ncbi:MAG: hypothetical protein ACI83P_000479 [Janthinobacterium sp.]|jgi:hypothetical protein